MDSKDWNLWSNITFKTQGYRKNFDMIKDDENFITEYDGTVSEIRLKERKMPVLIGEYGFSVWNINLGKKFGVNFDKLIKEHAIENTYGELVTTIKNKNLDISEYKKLVLVHTFILRKDYRKRGITEEFVEMLYRDFYCENIAIIALVKPFQNNPIDADFYFNRKSVSVKEEFNSEGTIIPAIEYYSLKELIDNKDTELTEYKLFSIASKCGFNRIDDSFLFTLSPEKIIERMEEKRVFTKIIEHIK
jgi:hypothetical protein